MEDGEPDGQGTGMKRVLMAAYYFPPAGGIGTAGAQRVLKFAKYLPCYGWRPFILTVREHSYETYLAMDPSLAVRIPSDTPTVRTPVFRGLRTILTWRDKVMRHVRGGGSALRAGLADPVNIPSAAPPILTRFQRFKDAITDLFEIPDEEMGWLVPGVVAGLRTIRRQRIDAIYATGRPWTALVIGLVLARLTGRPFLADFRDPWMTNPFRLPYSRLRTTLEAHLERAVVEGAERVIANTEALRDEFLQRFPHQPATKFVSLLNGFDPEDFSGIGAPVTRPGKHLTITHTGFLYLKRDPKRFLEAVKSAVQTGEVSASSLQVRFVGPVELPYSLESYAATAGLGDVIAVHGRVPYEESLEFLNSSDVLLLLQPGTKTQVPSKLFEYIGMRKPILAVSPLGGATAAIVADENLGEVADPEDVPAMANAIRRMCRQWRQGRPFQQANGGAFEKFNVKHLTGLLADHLSLLTDR